MNLQYLRQRLPLLSVALFCGWLMACEQPVGANAQFPDSITSSEVKLYPDAQLVDVRSPREWSRGHLQGALHLPVGEISEQTVSALPRDKLLVVYCAAGVRAGRAVTSLRELGFTAIAVRNGGFTELKTQFPTQP